MTDRTDVRPAGAERWDDVCALLGQRGSVNGCWCMWFRIPRSQWNEQKGAGNQAALREIVDGGSVPGLVAYRDGEPAGWCSIAPRTEFGGLDRSRVTKAVDDQPVWSLVCLYVDRRYRGAGVARELVRAAVAFAAKNGARIVEAYPVDDTVGPVSADEAYHGVASLLISEGFTEVARYTPKRPIMRKPVGD